MSDPLTATGVSRSQRVAGGWLFALGLLPVVVGGHDLLRGSDPAAKEFGLVLLLSGLALCLPAFLNTYGPRVLRVLGREPEENQHLVAMLGLIDMVVSLLLASYFTGLCVKSQDASERLWVPLFWGAVATVFAARLATLHVAGQKRKPFRDPMPTTLPPTSRRERKPVNLPLLAAVTLLVAAFQWWYATEYQPTAAVPTLDITTGLTKVGAAKGLASYSATVTVVNKTASEVRVMDSVYRVLLDVPSSERLSNAQVLELGLLDAAARGYSGTAESRYQQLTNWVMVESGRLFQPVPGTLEPNQTWTSTTTVSIPDDLTGKLRLEAAFTVARGNRLQVKTPGIYYQVFGNAPAKGQASMYVQWIYPIDEGSWVRELTRNSRVAAIWWLIEECQLPPGVTITDVPSSSVPVKFEDVATSSDKSLECNVIPNSYPLIGSYIANPLPQGSFQKPDQADVIANFYGLSTVESWTEQPLT